MYFNFKEIYIEINLKDYFNSYFKTLKKYKFKLFIFSNSISKSAFEKQPPLKRQKNLFKYFPHEKFVNFQNNFHHKKEKPHKLNKLRK